MSIPGSRAMRRGRRGQAMLEYVLVFLALAVATVAGLRFFNAGVTRATAKTRTLVTSPYP